MFKMYRTLVALSDSHKEKKKTFHTFFNILKFCLGHYTLEINEGQSWLKYIGPKREIPQVCLTRPVLTHFPLKVAWSGISNAAILLQILDVLQYIQNILSSRQRIQDN